MSLAPGISITQIDLNQGVTVPVTQAGAWLGPSERNTRLLAGRRTLVRVSFTLEEGWVEREIEAALELSGGGASETLSQIHFVDQDTVLTDPDHYFWFMLEPELGQTEADLQFELELRELGDEALGSEPGVALSPADGPQLFGFEELEVLPKITIVPYLDPIVTQPPALDYEELERRLLGWLPATDIELSVHAPVVLDEPITTLGTVYNHVLSLHDVDNPPGGTVYLAVVQSLQPVDGNTVFAGYPESNDTLPSKYSVHGAVAVWSADLETFLPRAVWSLFKTYGIMNVHCDVATAYPNPDYPYDSGKIGDWGFDVEALELYHPATSYDVNSNCEPEWYSDYTHDRVLTLLLAWGP